MLIRYPIYLHFNLPIINSFEVTIFAWIRSIFNTLSFFFVAILNWRKQTTFDRQAGGMCNVEEMWYILMKRKCAPFSRSRYRCSIHNSHCIKTKFFFEWGMSKIELAISKRIVYDWRLVTTHSETDHQIFTDLPLSLSIGIDMRHEIMG